MGVTIKYAHILLTGPVLIYIGLMKPKNKWIYKILLFFGLLLLVFFFYHIISTKTTPYHVWLYIHLILFIPLLIWIGIKKDQSPKILFSLIIAIGCAAIGYHAIRLFIPHSK
jgi:RsiW-degrading membrane proteinase PrsW (M82 family)